MEQQLQAARQLIFDKLRSFNPRTLAEYNGFIGEALSDISEDAGIFHAEYSVNVPNNMLFTDGLPKVTLLLEREPSAETERQIFSYFFGIGWEMIFRVDVLKSHTDEETGILETVFRQLYYVLNTLLQELLRKKLYLLDMSSGIPNLDAYIRFVDNLIAEGRIRHYTALYFNIHNFKSVHKSLSYLEANEVMTKYSHIVANAVTKSEMVARLGEDNFVAVITDRNRDYFMDLIQHMVVKYEKNGKHFSFLFGATVGATKLTDEKTGGEVMLHISLAYQSARENRVLLKYYDKYTNLELIEQKIILSKFPKAISDREFFAVYQPKVDAKTRKLVGAEALVRWKHDGGMVMPASFIPIFEKDGCVTSLDFYMLEEVCKFLRRLDDDGMGMVKMSVNFSKRHLSNNRLVEEIVDIIDRYEIPHEYIEIELTEGEDYENHSAMREIVNELKALGIKTSLDDFGTGYSSLSMLKTLQIDELKIDRSFIPQNDFSGSERSLRMLRGIITLAKSLGCTIVAEGVETQRQLQLIEEMNCDTVQGYLFDRPLQESDFVDRVRRSVYTLT